MAEHGGGIGEELAVVACEEDAFLTTRGRTSGEPHEVDIYFATQGETLYFLAGGGAEADWVKNVVANPAVTVRIGGRTFRGTARVLGPGEEEARARRLLAAKYERWAEGKLMSSWARTALPVAVDVSEAERPVARARMGEPRESVARQDTARFVPRRALP
jgi:deazaflavin-dependent oxidoreductase (nitroreductase family)